GPASPGRGGDGADQADGAVVDVLQPGLFGRAVRADLGAGGSQYHAKQHDPGTGHRGSSQTDQGAVRAVSEMTSRRGAVRVRPVRAGCYVLAQTIRHDIASPLQYPSTRHCHGVASVAALWRNRVPMSAAGPIADKFAQELSEKLTNNQR